MKNLYKKGKNSQYGGIPVSPGIAVGRALIYKREPFSIDTSPVAKDEIGKEVERFRTGLAAAKCQLEEIVEGARKLVGEAEAGIFRAHICMLEDPCFYEDVLGRIREAGLNAEAAVHTVLDELCKSFDGVEDEYLKERTADIMDISERLILSISGMRPGETGYISKDVIILAADLSPSDLALFGKKRVGGIALQAGGRTSHTSIMAKALGIPAVIGLGAGLACAADGEPVILDADSGILFLSPTGELLAEYTQKKNGLQGEYMMPECANQPQAITVDGKRIQLAASAGTIKDVCRAARAGAEGVGLLRTEFLFMDATVLPSEEEQLTAYQQVMEEMKGKPVIIRTLDIGGDKQLGYMDFPRETNPVLGWRGVRVSLDKPQLLKQQLRAVLRASNHGRVLVMYPMITSLWELEKMNEYLEQCKQELKDEKIPFDDAIPVGIMVETPAAAIMVDQLAKAVDFFSIGTNDLTQYTLAADRCNPKLVNLYQPLHPAVLRLIHNVIAASHKHGKWTEICGEATADRCAAMIFIGMGVDQISTEVAAIPAIREIIRSISHEEAKQAAARVLEMDTAAEIGSYVRKLLDGPKRSPTDGA
jgi:phosphoenolpyruvate-protein phosphotransferase (PTS system enzyme I)